MAKKKKHEPSPFESLTETEINSRFSAVERWESKLTHASKYQRDCERFSMNNHCLPIWALDIGNGKRSYLCESYTEMRKRLFNGLDKNIDCNYYEVNNPFLPTDFYIDCDIYTLPNPGVNGDSLYKEMITHAKEFLCKSGYVDSKDSISTYELDSTRSEKFSRHCVFRLPGKTQFKNVHHCQVFAYKFKDWMIEKYGPISQNKFFVKDKNGVAMEFATDLNVYTSWRLVRTIFSSKMGSKARLLPVGESDNNNDKRPYEKLRNSLYAFLDYFMQGKCMLKDIKIVTCQHRGGIEPTRELTVTAFNKKKNFPSSFDQNKAAIAKCYYASDFDFAGFWRKFGDPDREFGFEYALMNGNHAFSRNKHFENAQKFEESVKRSCPITIHTGAVKQDKIPDKYTRKFLSFDVDITDYKIGSSNIRLCCKEEKKCCFRCVPLLRFAMHVLYKLLVETFSLVDVEFYFSGLKGIHCWVFDKRVERYTEQERKTMIALVENTPSKKTSWFTKKVLEDGYFRQVYDLLIKSSAIEKLPDDATDCDIASRIWPVFDSEVTTQMNHLQKVPYSLHLTSFRPVTIIEKYKEFTLPQSNTP